MRRSALLAALGPTVVLVGTFAVAQPPGMPNPSPPGNGGGLSNLVQPSGEVDINAQFAVTPEAGEWMICAASYRGQDAPELANKLCQYLRERRVAAYVYNRGNVERKKMQEELDQIHQNNGGGPRRWRLAHLQEEQLAVLIGGFRDINAAHSGLDKVRKMPLPDIKLQSGKPAFDTYDEYEKVPGKGGYALKRYPINPFHNAFACPNPTIPQTRPKVAKVDPSWRKFNSEEPRSLFKCRKPWTLVVQEYTGAQVIQPTAASSGFLEKLGFSDHNLGKRLDQSARQARELCDMLRNDTRFKLKAYVLHTRTSSIVTVGEFDGPNDPNMQRVCEQLTHFTFKNGNTGEIVSLLWAKPMPYEVPK